MSAFSERLSYYIKKSGFSLKYLADGVGIDSTLLVKIKNGTRPARDKGRFYKLTELLQLSERDREELINAWEISLIGEEQYSLFNSLRTVLESIQTARKTDNFIMQEFRRGQVPKELNVLNSVADVNQAIHFAAISAVERKGGYIKIASNLHGDFMRQQLSIILPDHPELPVTHLISLLPASPDIETRKENIRRLGRIFPLIFSRGNYEPLYQYENDPGLNGSSMMPNVMITPDSVLTFSALWDRGLYFSGAESIRFFSDFFEKRKNECRYLGRRNLSLNEELLLFRSMKVPAETVPFYQISCQPCLLRFFKESDVSECRAAQKISETTLAFFFGGYQQKIKSSPFSIYFFDPEGLREFAKEGFVYEVPYTRQYPVPVAIRRRILADLLEKTGNGSYVPRALKPGRLHLLKNLRLMYCNSCTSISTFPTEQGQIGTNFAFTEPGIALSVEEFIHFLEEELWTYSRAESIEMVRGFLENTV